MKIMEFTLEQRKIIFNAVRNYQMNKVGLTSKAYETCDEILNFLFDEVTESGCKPSTDKHGGDSKQL